MIHQLSTLESQLLSSLVSWNSVTLHAVLPFLRCHQNVKEQCYFTLVRPLVKYDIDTVKNIELINNWAAMLYIIRNDLIFVTHDHLSCPKFPNSEAGLPCPSWLDSSVYAHSHSFYTSKTMTSLHSPIFYKVSRLVKKNPFFVPQRHWGLCEAWPGDTLSTSSVPVSLCTRASKLCIRGICSYGLLWNEDLWACRRT